MVAKNAGGGNRKAYPNAVEIGCLNQEHSKIIYFKIPKGHAYANCPVCGRRAGRK